MGGGGTQCKFENCFVFQWFFQSYFSIQPVALSGDLFPLRWVLQTRCLALLIRVNIFPRQFVNIRAEPDSLDYFFTDELFHLFNWFLKLYSRFLKWKNLFDSSCYGWSVLLWSFHLWYKVMSKTCYIFFAFISFSLLQSNCYKLYLFFRNFCTTTSTQRFHSKATTKLLVKLVEHQLEEEFFDGVPEMFNRGISFYSVS